MLISIINKVISKIKKDKYTLDPHISSSDIIIIVFGKLVRYIRGMIQKVGMCGSKKNVFIGKKTKLLHKKHISLGDGVQIKDYVEINGLCQNGIIIGDNGSIGDYTIIRGTGSLSNLGNGIKIGKNFGCGDFCFFGCSGGITIGDNVIMGQNVRFHSQNHNFDRVDIVIRDQGVISRGISVGSNCWFGSGAVILDGVKIGDGCVIGANTLVNKDIDSNCVVVGNPVRIVKRR